MKCHWNGDESDKHSEHLPVLLRVYIHGQELFYKFVSEITNKLVKQLLSMTVGSQCLLSSPFVESQKREIEFKAI